MCNSRSGKHVGRLTTGLVMLCAIFAAAAHAETVIVDDGGEGFSVVAGSWQFGTLASAYNENYRYKATRASAPYNSVQWQPTLSASDNYDVAVWYPAASNRPNNAVYVVHHAAGTTNITVDQTTNGGEWVTLGTFAFAAGTSGMVTLNDHAQVGAKNIAADAVRFRTSPGSGGQYRALWADVFHEGFKNSAQVDALISRAISGGYNVILPQMLAYQDNTVPSHGAHWRSQIVPTSSVVTESFDPLAELVQKGHAAGLQVHPWLVAFRVSNAFPPAGNTFLKNHPEYFMVPQDAKGLGTPVAIGSDFQLDPGVPGVQEHLVTIVREIATQYEVDGIHWDYIRYTNVDAGYPPDDSFAYSSLARFKRISDYSGTPPPTGEASWDDFRTRTITEIVRRVRAELADIASNPRQPLRQSGALITWGNAPLEFTDTSAYGLHQNWREWMEKGYFDFGVPMCYYNEGSYYTWYRNWVNAAVGWAYDRHMVIGPGIYLNSFSSSLDQIAYAEDAVADGVCTYSYGVTTNDVGEGSYWDWYPLIGANLWTSAVPVPSMSWRDPQTAIEGTIYGRVINGGDGRPIDNATVEAGDLSCLTDGNGYYVITMLPAGETGSQYDVTATAGGHHVTIQNVAVLPGGITRQDLTIGQPSVPPTIEEVTPDPAAAHPDQPYEQQLRLTQAIADSWTVIQGPNGLTVDATGLVTGWTPAVVELGQSFIITVRATNSVGSDDESWTVQVVPPPPCLTSFLTDFEGYDEGIEVLFQQPGFSSSTSANLDPNMSDSGVVLDEGFRHSQAFFEQWAFIDDSPLRWVRLTTHQADNVPNPTVRLDKPICIRLRLDSGQLRVVLGIRETGTNAEIGDDGGASGTIEWIGATGRIQGTPQGGRLLEAQPGVWQTLIFDPLTDPITGFTGDGILTGANGKGTLEEIALISEGSPGPYTLHIDNVAQLCGPVVKGDLNLDGLINSVDLQIVAECSLGSAVPTAPECRFADLDGDEDVDPVDFGLLQRCAETDAIPATPGCVP